MAHCNLDSSWKLWSSFKPQGLASDPWLLGMTDCSANGQRKLFWARSVNLWKFEGTWHDPQHHPPKFFQTILILMPKIKSYFSDFCGEIWCDYSKYFRRNQWKCLKLENVVNKTINNIYKHNFNFLLFFLNEIQVCCFVFYCGWDI